MRLSKIFCLFSLLAAAACSTSPEPAKTPVAVPSQPEFCPAGETPEPVSGKLDVYGAMARAAKYNTSTMSENIRKKIYTANPNMTPKDMINNILNSGNVKENQIYDGIRVLDYAIIYAVTNMSSSQQFINDNLLEKSAQNLALAAIKSHNDALFAVKEVGNISRQIEREQKQLNEVDARYNRTGRLTAAEEDYKKALTINIQKLKEMKDELLIRAVEYRNLIKDKSEKPDLDGRKFYELINLDRELTAADFEKSALYNRREFKLAREQVHDYSYTQVQNYMNLAFDNTLSLQINGYPANSPQVLEALEKQAEKAANNLIDAVINYRNNKKEERSFALKEDVYDNLAAAAFVQIELAYHVIEMVNLDLQDVNKKIKQLKKEISQLGSRDLSYKMKSELSDKNVKLVALQMTRSQILGERAVAIRSLYFYAGFMPFSCPVLKNRPKDIASVLRIGFNSDAVKMLMSIPEDKGNGLPKNVNSWAKSENWLEVLMKQEATGDETVTAESAEPESKFDLYSGEEPDRRKVMQLGVYKNLRNAEDQWKRLKEIYPQLKSYRPSIERERIDGKVYNRLTVKSFDGRFRDLCNELRRDKVECVLK